MKDPSYEWLYLSQVAFPVHSLVLSFASFSVYLVILEIFVFSMKCHYKEEFFYNFLSFTCRFVHTWSQVDIDSHKRSE